MARNILKRDRPARETGRETAASARDAAAAVKQANARLEKRRPAAVRIKQIQISCCRSFSLSAASVAVVEAPSADRRCGAAVARPTLAVCFPPAQTGSQTTGREADDGKG